MKWCFNVIFLIGLLASNSCVFASAKGHAQSTHDELPAITRLPFELQDRLIMIKADINGVYGNYLFDTGAQTVVLNSARFGADDIETFAMNHAAPSGAGGAMSNLMATRNLTLKWGDTRMDGLMGLVTDLSHMEQNLGGYELCGIIGFNVLEQFEIHFDYAAREVLLLALDADGTPRHNPVQAKPEQSISFEMERHIPVLPVKVGPLELRMGLDSGAAGQMIFTRHQAALEDSYEFIRTDNMKGADLNVQSGDVVRIPEMSVDGLAYPGMIFRFNDLAAHGGQAMPFDGLLGYEFLQTRPTALNLRARKLYIWPRG